MDVKQIETVTVVRMENTSVAIVASFSPTTEGKEKAEKLFVALAKVHVKGFAEDESAEGICIDEGLASDGFNSVYLMNSNVTDATINKLIKS